MTKDNSQIMDETLSQVTTVFDSDDQGISSRNENELHIAFQVITKHLNVPLVAPVDPISFQNAHELVMAIARGSGLRLRSVTLSHNWWKSDNGPMMVFLQNTSLPLALIFNKAGYYQYYDPQINKFVRLSLEVINNCFGRAYTFYRTFPDTVIKLRTLFNFSIFNLKWDCFRIVLVQVFIGLLGLFVPIATGVVLDQAVPNANLSILSQCVFGILACSFASALFYVAQNLAMIRIRFKTNAALEPAIWDRLLRLPTSFFHRYSPGDLTLRASGIDTMQTEITGSAIQSVLSGIFSFITLGLMFYYSPILASFSLLATFVVIILITISNIVLLKYQRPMMNIQGKLASLSFQFVVGISKLRLSNSEYRAFSIWFEEFCKQNRLTWLASLWAIRFGIIRNLISVLIFIMLYSLVGSGLAVISFGAFIAFNAAFGQFFSSLLSLAEIMAKFINLVPLYERISPILNEIPENEGLILHQLSGKVAVRDLSFHYHMEHLPVLENINLHANEGEFVALTGATGSGKSTLFRLLLGFETPTKGNIYYDEQNLNKLNIRSLREQCGVVLQNGAIFPGTIFENIMGSRSFSVEDAWEAAKLSGLAADIQAMPMGMNTLLTERGSTLSVGQRQRLMIARALSRKPKLLLLDEATSALDNITQAEVMNNIEQLKITRIVAAHRLSTLIKADRIYVLSEGKIVQTGTYDALMQQGGMFENLVKQQMI
ncbi:MAG: NHLP bacteriocin export ABC transporter permease/ATPase subunit [Legionella sp.]|jgi:NHLM bacteriocin system ABC transporter ATP-binding protein